MTEGQHRAASMKVGISNYVASAALAVIGGAAALYTYISQTFNPSMAFEALMMCGLISLVLSIVVGGAGADDATNAVADDTWGKNTSGGKFNTQAVLTLIGLILVIAATVIGASSDRHGSAIEDRLEKVEQRLVKLETRRP